MPVRDTPTSATGRTVRVAVIGGGINGSGIAWELARRDYQVTLFDKGACGAQTSAATTKMVHGGLRYLERLHVALVRESLRERAWLLEHIPQLVKPLEIALPIYRDSPRSRLTIAAGLRLYDALAGLSRINSSRSIAAASMTELLPLRGEGLRGGFSYWDAQVDDHALVRAVVASARKEGADVREFTRVNTLRRNRKGWTLDAGRGDEQFDVVVAATGPWMNELLGQNGIRARYRLSLVRGSHLILRHRVADIGALLQSTSDRRVLFVLPWKETTLVGTTEVVQREPLDDVHPSDEEIDYLIERFNRYFRQPISRADVAATFSGVRPLVGRSSNPSAIGRDYRITRSGTLINVFGGKLTTFMALARKVALRVDNATGGTREAREPVFEIEN